MHDALYVNQDALETDDLLEYGVAAGVEPAVVASDLVSGTMTSRVRKDFRSGIRSGVNGTPTFFVNGRRFTGDWADPVAFAAALHEAARAGTHTAR
jgi:protein-disulfide isomerase